MATTIAQLQSALDTLSQDIANTLQPGANVSGPTLAALLTRQTALTKDLSSLQAAGASVLRYGASNPVDSLGSNNDIYRNTTTWDEYQKVNGTYVLRGNIRGTAGYTPQKGKDYVDGEDGLDGNEIVDKTYAPTAADNAGYKEGDQWFYTKSLSSYERYAYINGAWRLVFRKAETTTTPPVSADTQAPNVSFTAPASGATVPVGTQLTLTATATDNVAVTAVEFLNGATGASLGQGAKNGTTYTLPYTVSVAGPLSLVAKASDAAGNVQTATVNITVVASASAPGQVAGVTATPGNTQVGLNWAEPVTGGAPISSYTVRYRPVGATSYSVFGTTANPSITVTGLSNGQAYEFTVAATNSVGTGTASTAVTATPVASATETITITDVFGDEDDNQTGDPAAYLTSISWTEAGRVRQQELLPSAMPIYTGGTGATLNADAVLTNTTTNGPAALSKSVNGNGDFVLSKVGSGISVATFPALAKAAWVNLEIVLTSASVSAGASYADLMVGLFADNTQWTCNAAAFRLKGTGNTANFQTQGGQYFAPEARNPALSTGVQEQRVYAVLTHDYLIGGVLVGGTMQWGFCTDLSKGFTRPGNLNVLTTQKIGVALSSDGDMAVAIKSVKATYHGGFGAADHQWLSFEDGSPYIDSSQPNKRWGLQSCKGVAADGHNTADHATLRLFSTDITNANRAQSITHEKLLFVNRGGVIEGDFSAGGMVNRATGQLKINTPMLGGQKDFSTPFYTEILTLPVSVLTSSEKILVVAENQRTGRVTVAGEDPHDPAAWFIDTDGTIYWMYSVQTGGPTQTRFAQSTDGGLTWTRYDQSSETDPAGADDEGNKIFRYQGEVYGVNTRKHTQKGRLYHLKTGAFLGTMTDPVVQSGSLSQAQQSHLAILIKPGDVVETWGFTTDPPTGAVAIPADQTSFYPPASSLGAHYYTNGETRIHTPA